MTMLPLSPSQRGMLFETLASRRPGIHLEQSILALRGNVDPATFEAAWRRVLRHHPALRTAFVWRDVDEPRRITDDDATLDLITEDWSALPAAEQRARLQRALDADRARGFDLSRAPLMRVALYRLGHESWQAVWTHHHILLDGWCVPLIARDLIAAYDAAPLEPVPPYDDYLQWLDRQDLGRAEAYWRGALRGITAPTALGTVADAGDDTHGPAERRLLLSRATTGQLRRLARANRVPINVLFHGIWALLLSRYSGDRRVLFGATVSGRPAGLPGVADMIGLFINTVPVAVDVTPSMPLGAWLRGLHEAQSEREPFDYCATGQVHDWSAVPRALPLFESILVFENYPVDADGFRSRHFELAMEGSRTVGANTRFALTLLIEPGDEIALTAVYDRARLGAADVDGILQDVLLAAESLGATPDTVLEALRHRPIPTIRRKAREVRAPRTATEAAVAAVWSELLGETSHDNFFDAGGHSLLATQAIVRLREAFALDIPLRALFENPTVEALSRWIDAQPRGRRVPPPIVPLSRRDEVPASFAQERLWFLQQLDPASTAYNAQGALLLRGALDVPALQAALDGIIRRHEVLRTSFSECAGKAGALKAVATPPHSEERDGFARRRRVRRRSSGTSGQ